MRPEMHDAPLGLFHPPLDLVKEYGLSGMLEHPRQPEHPAVIDDPPRYEVFPAFSIYREKFSERGLGTLEEGMRWQHDL